ncbi:MAG: hypothetical protein ACI9ON_002396 [Limisphaerales bacterium]|jgi:hypothetical protein
MSATETKADFQRVLQMLSTQPALLDKYQLFVQQLNSDESVPAKILEMMRRRIGQIHGTASKPLASVSPDEDLQLSRAQFSQFSDDAKAALTIAELMPFGHADISDHHVAKLQHYFGERGAVVVLVAAAFQDVECRLAQSLDARFAGGLAS